MALVAEALPHSGLEPQLLELEITEFTLIQDAQALPQSLGCACGQGFLIARPLPALEFAGFLEGQGG